MHALKKGWARTKQRTSSKVWMPPFTKQRRDFANEILMKDLVEAVDASVQQAVDKKIQETLDGVRDKADFLITQKKFELKDELTKELATKADIALLKGDIARLEGLTKENVARLEGEIKTSKVELDRKFTIMFLILLFSIFFVNQNAIKFIAELFGLIKP
jgi:hypothetical protein